MDSTSAKTGSRIAILTFLRSGSVNLVNFCNSWGAEIFPKFRIQSPQKCQNSHFLAWEKTEVWFWFHKQTSKWIFVKIEIIRNQRMQNWKYMYIWSGKEADWDMLCIWIEFEICIQTWVPTWPQSNASTISQRPLWMDIISPRVISQ